MKKTIVTVLCITECFLQVAQAGVIDTNEAGSSHMQLAQLQKKSSKSKVDLQEDSSNPSAEVRKIGTAAATKGAKGIERILNKAIDEKSITIEDLFDENYVLIPNTYPLKFRTRFDALLDKKIQAFEDSIITDYRIQFAIAVDRNGYLPTHNSKFSKPLTGDPEKDIANNKAKRFYNDPIGIAAARNKSETLVQLYQRDNGDQMCDFAAPIFVKGKHWGAFRVGMKTN